MPGVSPSLGRGPSNPGKKRNEFFYPYFLHKIGIFLTFLNRYDEMGIVKDEISRY
jgi:hypothetical protein